MIDYHHHIINGKESGPPIDLGDGSHYHKYGFLSLRKTDPTWNDMEHHFHLVPGREISSRIVSDAIWSGVYVKPARLHVTDRFKQVQFGERIQEVSRKLGLKPMAGGAAGTWTFTNGGRTSLIDGTFDID
jgi:hypothetical protein